MGLGLANSIGSYRAFGALALCAQVLGKELVEGRHIGALRYPQDRPPFRFQELPSLDVIGELIR